MDAPVRFGTLKRKEIVCIRNGMRLGYADDLLFDPETYRITHLVAYGRWRFFGLFGKFRDVRIPCGQIRLIGEDIILVEDFEAGEGKAAEKGHFWERFFE